MDQSRVGRFLKELRGEKALTQEQLAEILGVSNRSISRWENGVTMPAFDLLMQMAAFYGVEIGEILDGERKPKAADEQPEETLRKIVDYHSAEREAFARRLHVGCVVSLAGMAAYALMDRFGLTEVQPYRSIVNIVLGMVVGALIAGTIYTSRHLPEIRAAKLRLWKRFTGGGQEK